MAQESIRFNVPFVTQAPTGNWDDPIFKDACEETALIMAYAWITEQRTLDPAEVEQQLREVAAWEVEQFGVHQDTSAADTFYVATEYFYMLADLRFHVTTDDILNALNERNLAILPVDASKLYKNGPPRHMIVVTGYDPATNEFIFSDPGKTNGANMRVNSEILQNSLRDYSTGNHLPVTQQQTAMIEINWPWALDPEF